MAPIICAARGEWPSGVLEQMSVHAFCPGSWMSMRCEGEAPHSGRNSARPTTPIFCRLRESQALISTTLTFRSTEPWRDAIETGRVEDARGGSPVCASPRMNFVNDIVHISPWCTTSSRPNLLSVSECLLSRFPPSGSKPNKYQHDSTEGPGPAQNQSDVFNGGAPFRRPNLRG